MRAKSSVRLKHPSAARRLCAAASIRHLLRYIGVTSKHLEVEFGKHATVSIFFTTMNQITRLQELLAKHNLGTTAAVWTQCKSIHIGSCQRRNWLREARSRLFYIRRPAFYTACWTHCELKLQVTSIAIGMYAVNINYHQLAVRYLNKSSRYWWSCI